MGEGLRLGGLRLVVDRTVHKGLQELQVLKLLWGEALELARVSRGEGEDLVDVNADHVVGIQASLYGSNDRTGVVAVRAVAVVAKPPHELGPSPRGALRIPARLGGRPRESEDGKRGNHHMERIDCFSSVGARVGERADEVQILHNRTGVPVADYQWERIGLGGADVQEVDVLAVDGSGELRILVELRLPPSPVVSVLPVLG